jgi:predicted ester cyclase
LVIDATTRTLAHPSGTTDDPNVERMRRLLEEGFSGHPEVIDELMAPDCIEHQRGNRSGVEGAKATAATLHRWMSEFTLTMEDVAVSGQTVWTRNRARGNHTGTIMGTTPTGRHVEVDVIDICRFEDGRVVEHWGIADQVGLLLQIGAFPERGRPS